MSNRPINLLICGGGALAHGFAAVIGPLENFKVRVLTRRPDLWGDVVRATYDDLVVEGRAQAGSDPSMSSEADLVLIAAPAFAHATLLGSIAPYVRPDAWIGALPAPGGFDLLARRLLLRSDKLFGSLRAPYNARVLVRGELVQIFGIIPRLDLVASSDSKEIGALLLAALGIPVRVIEPFLSASLSPASTILHAARIFELLNRQGSSFYREWGPDAARAYLAMDAELGRLRDALGIADHGVTASAHYGTNEPDALAERIRSLRGLPDIPPPFIDGQLDASHRFVREDVPYGLRLVQHVARIAETPCKTIDEVAQAILAALPAETRSELDLPDYLAAATLADFSRNPAPCEPLTPAKSA